MPAPAARHYKGEGDPNALRGPLMNAPHADRALREVRRLVAEHALAEWPDASLLESFAARRDDAAFEALLRRHGPMVLRVCRGCLSSPEDADDAFQATFLVLACRAARVRRQASVGSFPYGTAPRAAGPARARALGP